MKAFVRYNSKGIIVPSSFVMKKNKPKVGNWLEISSTKSVSGSPAENSQGNLRAFVRYNGQNKVVPGSIVVRGQVPTGNFSEVTYDLARPLVPRPTPTTTTTSSTEFVFTPISKTELQTAVELWVNNEAQAIITYGEINTWNTVNITDMSSLFRSLVNFYANFNDDISSWNTSNVTDMSRMFSSAHSFHMSVRFPSSMYGFNAFRHTAS